MQFVESFSRHGIVAVFLNQVRMHKTAFEKVFRVLKFRVTIRHAVIRRAVRVSIARRETSKRKNPWWRCRNLSNATVAVPQPPSLLLFGRQRYFVSQDISRDYKSLRSRKSYHKILRYPHFHIHNICSWALLLTAHSRLCKFNRWWTMYTNLESFYVHVLFVATNLAYLAIIFLQLYFFLSIYIEPLVHKILVHRKQSFLSIAVSVSVRSVNGKSIIPGQVRRSNI